MTAGNGIRGDLAAAFGLLTRLPVGWLAPPGAPFRLYRCGWCFPLVGAVVGGIGAAALSAGTALGLPRPLAACWTLAMLVLATGGLHEDGMADAADGSGGRTPGKRLEIMRDSRIGSYGALALLLSAAIRITAVAALPVPRAGAALVCAGALSRAAMLVVVAGCRPARPDGIGRAMSGPAARPSLAVGGSIAGGIAMLAAPPLRGAAAAALAVAVGLGAARAARRGLGGYTGDVLGATTVVAECVVLSLLAAV